MRLNELEHLIRAAGAVTDEDQLVIIGSQSILATFPDAAPELLQSMEADIITLTLTKTDPVLLKITDPLVARVFAGNGERTGGLLMV